MKRRDLAPLMDRLRQVVRIAKLTLVDDSQAPQRLQTVTRQGDAEDGIRRYQPYGLRSIPSAGAQVVLLSLGGYRRDTLAIAIDAGVLGAQYLAPGDVALDDYRGLTIRLTTTGIVIEGNNAPVLITGTPKLRVEGAIEATGEITAMADSAPIPLSTHVTTHVQAGSALSGGPQAP